MKSILLSAAMALSLTLPAFAADHEEEIDFIDEFQGYLAISESFTDLAGRTDAAVFFAVEGIVEIHEARGTTAEAIPMLEAYLEGVTTDQAARNIIRFKLRDLYEETGQADAALAQLDAVMRENQ